VWRWWTKSKEEDAVVAGAGAPCRGRGLVLRDVSHMRNVSHPVVTTKLKENQTSWNAATAEVRPAITTVLAATP